MQPSASASADCSGDLKVVSSAKLAPPPPPADSAAVVDDRVGKGADGDADSARPAVVSVGSRRSELALRQTHEVLRLLGPDCGRQFRIVHMDTIGDQILDRALSHIGDKGLFTKELDAALLSGEVSLVVHSLKDLPTQCPPGLAVPCILRRELPRDALVLHPRHVAAGVSDLAGLPAGSVIGTSSLRRSAQLSRAHPGLRFQSVRGNLGTRWRKLNAQESGLDGLILAEAGLVRMGWEDRMTCSLDSRHCLPAVGQGALAVQCRDCDEDIVRLLRPLLHRDSFMEAVAERSLLRALDGGCSVPMGVRSVWTEPAAADADSSSSRTRLLSLEARVLSLDGAEMFQFEAEEPLVEVEDSVEEEGAAPPSAKRRRESTSPSAGDAQNGEEAAAAAAESPERFIGLHYPQPDRRDLRHLAACVRLGRRVADGLLAQGAGPVLAAAKAAARAATGKLAPPVPQVDAQPSS